MQTGARCPICERNILIGDQIIGFPVIRITGMNQSKMTGEEMLIHAGCFGLKMRQKEQKKLSLVN